MWNSAFITNIYLIQKAVLKKIKGSFGPSEFDPDMAMCKFLRINVSTAVCYSELVTSYRIYSIKLPGCLINFWTLRVGAYLRLGAY